MTKRSGLLASVGLFVLAFALAGSPAVAHHKQWHGATTGKVESSTTTTTTTASDAEPVGVVPVCGNAAMLDGPSSPPTGAVTVQPGQNLNDVTKANVAGTEFYLTAGTHTLADSIYGQVIPKEGNSYIGAPGAVLDGRQINRYAFTQKAANVTIKHLTVTGFMAPGDEGVVNHDFGVGWVIERNTVHKNNGAGVMLGDDNRMVHNCLADNGQYGFQGKGKRLTIDGNEVARNNVTNWETNAPGCGCSGGAKFWNSGPGTVTNNWVHDNYNVGLWWDNNNVGFLVEGNVIENNRSHGIFYETSYNAVIRDNVLRGNAIPKGQEFQARNSPFPVGAIYLSEAGGDARVIGGSTLEITGNTFEGNWAGVVAWENADRFGHDGSANTSKGYTTLLVDPSGAKFTPEIAKCGDPAAGGLVDTEPYYSDCRWKTQNVLVSGNTFAAADPGAIGCTSVYCNQQALFSNYGTTPSWSPYKRRVVQDNITFRQNNVWRDNTYTGEWRFTAYEMGSPKTWEQWQAAPFSQDAGSTIGS